MSRTNFTGPVSFGEVNDPNQSMADTRGFVPGRKQFNLSQASPSASVVLPPKSTLTKCAFVPTSAFTGTDPVSAMNVTFSNGTQVHAVITASAYSRYHESTFVSAADAYEAGGTLSVTLSALSTTVFTGGGGRAFIEYITVE